MMGLGVIILINMKKCRKCGEEKDEGEFGKNKTQIDRLHYYCKSCCSKIGKQNGVKYKDRLSKYRKEYRIRNKHEIRLYQKIYRKDHHETIIAKQRKYRDDNWEQYSLSLKMDSKSRRDRLDDSYVLSVICQRTRLKPSDIPPELIEVKRLIIKTKRLCKQQSQTSQNLETV